MYVATREPAPVIAALTETGKNQDAGNVSYPVMAMLAEANQSDDFLKGWLLDQRKKVPTPVLLARFAPDEFSNERLEVLLDLGFDSWVVGMPSWSLIEKICSKVSSDLLYVSVKYGRLFLHGNLFWRGKVQIKLSTKESLILRMLLKAGNAPVSIEQLLIAHGYKPDTKTHTIETHIYRLKQKLQTLRMENTIVNIKKEGYRLLL